MSHNPQAEHTYATFNSTVCPHLDQSRARASSLCGESHCDHRAQVHTARNPTVVSFSSGWYCGLRAHVTLCAAVPRAQNLSLPLSIFLLQITFGISRCHRTTAICSLFVFVSAGMPACANQGSCPNQRNHCDKNTCNKDFGVPYR